MSTPEPAVAAPAEAPAEAPADTRVDEPAEDGIYTPDSATQPLPESAADELPRRRAEKRRPRKQKAAEQETAEQKPAKQKVAKARKPLSMPRLPGRVAAVATGLLVGAAGAAATFGAMAGCKAVRGVSSCGGAPGFFILVAIFVGMVLFGNLVLRLFKVGDPGSTSFLAVGLVAVVVMLGLLDVIFSVWMFAVVPVLGAFAYLLAHWVTTRFDHETGRRDWV